MVNIDWQEVEGHLSKQGGGSLTELIQSIGSIDQGAEAEAKARWLDLCKPLFALGQLEEIVIRLAGIQQRGRPRIGKKAIAIFGADNGLVAQGVTQVGQEVTAVVMYNFARGITTVNAMARQAGADLFPVDVGVNQPGKIPGVIDARIRQGTDDISLGPAMSRQEALEAIMVGARLAIYLADQGYDLLGTGEMGIGNTSSSSALLAAMTGKKAVEVTGRGAGLSDAKFLHKQKIIDRSLAVNQLDSQDLIGLIAAVGGLDLAALTGFYLGSAVARRPVIVDGFIAAVSALAAIRMAPAVRPFIFPSHLSAEPGAAPALEEIGYRPWFDCGMRVGEGTGCCLAFDLFDQALAAFDHIATWEEAGIGAYCPQEANQC